MQIGYNKSTNFKDFIYMSVRLDKWLWAARFYKTRALAKKAIEGGKVHFQGQKTKVSKAVNIGDKYQIIVVRFFRTDS